MNDVLPNLAAVIRQRLPVCHPGPRPVPADLDGEEIVALVAEFCRLNARDRAVVMRVVESLAHHTLTGDHRE
jgi:hypothetical protein